MSKTKINHKREINGVLYLMAALIMAAAFYLPAGTLGWLGNFLVMIGRGLLGTAGLALPVVFAYMAIDYFVEKQIKRTRLRFSYVFLLLLGAAALMHALTVDQTKFQSLILGTSQTLEAWKAVSILWTSGYQSDILLSAKMTLPGGLLGGGVAQALLAIAGQIGAVILISALVLSQLILLLNVSLTRAVGKTAVAIQQTSKRVDNAVRTSVENMREYRASEAKRANSYDLLLEKGQSNTVTAADSEDNGEPEKKKYSLLDSLKRLWGAEEVVLPVLPAEELAVPEFLQADAAVVEAARIEPHSPYDIKIKTPEYEPILPAGIHRVGGAVPIVHEHHVNEDLDAEDGRASWTDRTADAAGVDLLSVRKKSFTGAPGAQLSLEIPYQIPPINLLREETAPIVRGGTSAAIQALGKKLEHTLESFGIAAKVINVTTGPTITRFELSPGPGVKVSRIVSLSDDIALNLAAMGVRIEAPIPGKSAIGIEIPNKETSPVLLRGLLESPEFKRTTSPLTAVLGRDIQGAPILCDLAKMPHLLIAGATGSGKSVCINSILMSILYRSSPEDVRMMMIDPKVVELNVYNGIPHLLAPVVTDPKKAANTLMWAVNEMTRRYGLFAEKSVRDINSYNASALCGDDDFEKLPLILFVIDELSDLMATTPTEVEDAIARLTAMARAAGIHLIIATQRPSVDVITGVIKANIPSRIAFAVASQVDSRTILDIGGAEKLLGKGDMLYDPQSSAKPIRGQGAFVTDSEVERVLTYIKTQHAANYDQAITDAIMTVLPTGKERDSSEQDELLPQAIGIVVETGYASVSLLQRRMNVGYPRAARLIDRMNEAGYVGPFEGSKPRKVLITHAQYLELMTREGN